MKNKEALAIAGDRIPVQARFSAPVQTGPGAHPASCTMGTGSFPGSKERPGRNADPLPTSSVVIKKGQSYSSTPSMGRTACTEPQCLYKGALYLLPFIQHYYMFRAVYISHHQEKLF